MYTKVSILDVIRVYQAIKKHYLEITEYALEIIKGFIQMILSSGRRQNGEAEWLSCCPAFALNLSNFIDLS
jgi:hypothetical protein